MTRPPRGRRQPAPPTRTPADTRGTRAWWPPVAIVVVAIAAYANALGNPFVMDDVGSIDTNPTIRSLWTSLGGGPVQSSMAGRPLPNITLALNYALGGTTPGGYHLFNAAVVVACAMLLFGILRRTLAQPRVGFDAGRAGAIAAAVALLWTAHPLPSEVVNYVTQRTESLMGLALLATLYAGLRGMTAGRPARWLVLSVVACAAGMASKESMATAPLLVLLFDGVFVADGPADALRRRPLYYLALAATWLLLAALVVGGPRSHSAGFSSGVSPLTYLFNQPALILRYLRLAVLPVGLVLDYGEPRAMTLADAWLPGLAVLALLGAGLAAWRWHRPIAFLATAFFILLAPTSSFVPIATEAGAERRMLLPLAAVLTLLVLGAVRLLDRLPRADTRRWIAAGSGAVACLLLVVLTVQRNSEYASGLRIWQTVVDRRPHGRALHNLGVHLSAAGRRDEAVAAYERALPDSPEASYALAFERQADRRFDEAADLYAAFIRLRPEDVNVLRAYHQIGRTRMEQGRYEQAVGAFQEVLARKPGDPDALGGLADSLMGSQRLPEAVAAYQEYLRVNPSSGAARFNLGVALSRLGRHEEAAGAFQAFVGLEPSNVAGYVNLGTSKARAGHMDDAAAAIQKAVELEQDPAEKESLRALFDEILEHRRAGREVH